MMTTGVESEIAETIERYYELVSTDIEAAARCYSEPVLAGTSSGFAVFNQHRDIAAGLKAGLVNADRLGYVKTRPEISFVHLLSKNAALASVLAVRVGSDGQEIERAGFTYVLHNESGKWRIKCLIATDADRLVGR